MFTQLSRLTADWSAAWRKWRLYRHRTVNRSRLNLNLLERTILEHLYKEKAEALGLSWHLLGPILVIEGRGKVFRTQGVWTDFDTMPLANLCGDKLLVRALLAEAGLRIPDGAAFPRSRWGEAWAYARSLSGACVVKPARGTSSGAGVSVGVTGRSGFRRAFRLAGLYGDDVLVERFAPGQNYRLLVFRGRTISVLLRDLPSVTGDGTRPVAALIARENASRIRSDRWSQGDPVLMPLPSGPRARGVLARQGLTLASVPAAGLQVRLADTCNYAQGTSYLEVSRETGPDLLQAAERAATVLGTTLAGVDIITPDLRGEDYVINEVNTTPGMESHYFAANEAERKDPIREVFEGIFGPRPEKTETPGNQAT